MKNYEENPSRMVQLGSLAVDFERRMCFLDGMSVQLSKRELQVLARLSPDEFRSNRDIIRSLAAEWYPEAVDKEYLPEDLITPNYLRGLVNNLRVKLGSDVIETMNGAGYRLKPTKQTR